VQVLIVLFSLTALGALYGMVKYGGWNFTLHSANVVFVYIFLLSIVTVLWSWIAMKEMEKEDEEAELAAQTQAAAALPAIPAPQAKSRGPRRTGQKRKKR